MHGVYDGETDKTEQGVKSQDVSRDSLRSFDRAVPPGSTASAQDTATTILTRALFALAARCEEEGDIYARDLAVNALQEAGVWK